MSEQNQNTISPEQVADAAAAGLELFDKEIPMSRTMRRRISLLELVLNQIASGNAVVVNPPREPVQSSEKTPAKGPAPVPSPKPEPDGLDDIS